MPDPFADHPEPELVDVRDGSRMWGERYDRPMREMLDTQETIARELAGRLRPRLTGEEQRLSISRSRGESKRSAFVVPAHLQSSP